MNMKSDVDIDDHHVSFRATNLLDDINENRGAAKAAFEHGKGHASSFLSGL
jgi:hypothetical protein